MAVLEADIPKIARESAAIYQRWKPMIDRYHGGMPAALLAVRMWVESRGTDDQRIGSDTATGVLSVTRNQEIRFGVPVDSRMVPENNVFLAAARNNVDTLLFTLRYPGLARSLADAYVFGGQLVSAIGTGAAAYLFKRAPRGQTYDAFTKWVAAEAKAGRLPESGPWGSQSLAKIVERVRAMWTMNEAANRMQRDHGVSNRASAPHIPPLPAGLGSFGVPKEIRGRIPLSRPLPPAVWLAVAVVAGLGAWWLS